MSLAQDERQTVPAPSRLARACAIGLVLYGGLRFWSAGLSHAIRALAGDFGASFPTAYFAKWRPDFPTTQVWPGWSYGPVLHFMTLPLLALPRWWMVPPAWAIVNLTCLVVSFSCVLRISEMRDRVSWPVLAALAGLWLGFQPLINCFAQGNIEIVELALTLSALVWLRRGRDRASGLLMGLAVMTKFLPIGFLGWYVLRGRWRAALVGALVIVGLAGAAGMTLGWMDNVQVHQTMVLTRSAPPGGPHELSVTSMFLHRAGVLNYPNLTMNWYPSARALAASHAGSLASVLLLVPYAWLVIARRRRPVVPLEVGVLFMTMFMLVPWNHDYYYIFSLVAFSVLALTGVVNRRWGLLAAVLTAYVLMSPPVPFSLIDRWHWFPISFAEVYGDKNVPVAGALLLLGIATGELLNDPVTAETLARRLPLWRAVRLGGIIAVIVLGLFLWTGRPRGAAPPSATSLTFDPPLLLSGPQSLVVSPDGQRVAYIADVKRARVLCVRAWSGGQTTCWNDLSPAAAPAFSPDGHWIAFFHEGALAKVPADGGELREVMRPAPRGETMSWPREDTIVISGIRGISRVSLTNGSTELLAAARSDGRYLSPILLPAGDTLIFTMVPSGAGMGVGTIVARSLSTGRQTAVLTGSQPFIDPDRHRLIYLRGNRIMSAPFDLVTQTVTTLAEPLASNALVTRDGGAQFAVARDGTIAYVRGDNTPVDRRSLVWVDRAGRETPVPVPPAAYEMPRLSPRGDRLAAAIRDVVTDVWSFALATGDATRVSAAGTVNDTPVWMPDGSAVSYAIPGLTASWPAVFATSLDRTMPSIRLWQARRWDPREPIHLSAWSPDGRFLAGSQAGDLWLLDVSKAPVASSADGLAGMADAAIGRLSSYDQTDPLGTTAPAYPQTTLSVPSRAILLQRPIIERKDWTVTVSERDPVFSPDGRWLAFTSDRSGENEVYVQSFPDLGALHKVSTGGGVEPLWSHDGRELFYRVRDAVRVVPVQTGANFSAGPERHLFAGPYVLGPSGATNYEVAQAPAGGRNYDVSADGQRFMMIRRDETVRTPTLTVLRGSKPVNP